MIECIKGLQKLTVALFDVEAATGFGDEPGTPRQDLPGETFVVMAAA